MMWSTHTYDSEQDACSWERTIEWLRNGWDDDGSKRITTGERKKLSIFISKRWKLCFFPLLFTSPATPRRWRWMGGYCTRVYLYSVQSKVISAPGRQNQSQNWENAKLFAPHNKFITCWNYGLSQLTTHTHTHNPKFTCVQVRLVAVESSSTVYSGSSTTTLHWSIWSIEVCARDITCQAIFHVSNATLR